MNEYLYMWHCLGYIARCEIRDAKAGRAQLPSWIES